MPKPVRSQTAEHGFAPDTIFAPATGSGRAAVAIVRISGGNAHHALRSLTEGSLPQWRELALRDLVGADGMMIDRAMVAAFPEGASYTGEPMAEIHCHASRAVLADLIAELARIPGCRLAEPGEFTRRAFLAGRMDLSEAEGLADLIAAETSRQRRQALRVHRGAVSRQTEAWRQLLLRARALVEVTIDWADEDLPDGVMLDVSSILRELEGGMKAELGRSATAERMRSGFEVAIVGPPNVGKSSLLNAIAGREAALVSEIAGTTRDVIEVRFDLAGLPVVFLDTAGIREAGDAIEEMGVTLALRRAEAADLRLILASPDTGAVTDHGLRQAGDIRVWSKSDLGPGEADVSISTSTGAGIDALLARVEDRLTQFAADAGIIGHQRQRLAVEAALAHIKRCSALVDHGPAECAGEELRLACGALDRLTGRIGVEDVLGEVFGSFCLGK